MTPVPAIRPARAPAAEDRFGRVLERADGVDFPYYNGVPVSLSGAQWGGVLGAVVLAFGLLTALPIGEVLAGLPLALLFAGVPLAGLALVTRAHWTALFRRVTPGDLPTMVGVAVVNIVVSFAVGLAVGVTIGGAAPNPQAGALVEASNLDRLLFYARTAVQLLGEELLTVLPFLALLTLGATRLGLSRRRAVVVAWLLSALLFGLAHLPTYDWNLVQCLVVIGSARLVLSVAYLRTKNLWVSTGAHILNDWTLFSLPLLTRGTGG
jgi:membrane protease YdiL (CAAX protease family)